MTTEFSIDFQTVAQLFDQDNHVLVACSGGVDSVVLAHAIVRQSYCRRVSICYVDHGIHEKTDEQWVTVESLARKLGVESYRVKVDSRGMVEGNGPEDAARRERYRCLEQCRAEIGADCIALGHHADDQVETFIIRLSQGSGLFGLRGMASVHGRLRRPLLTFRKSELVKYAERFDLVASEDPTNCSELYFRNRVRHSLLPTFDETLGPHWRKHILNLMSEFGQRAALDSHLAETLFKRLCRVESKGLRICRRSFGELFAHEQYLLARLCLDRILGIGVTRRAQILRVIEELSASSTVHRWQLTNDVWVCGEYKYAFIGNLEPSQLPVATITAEGVFDWGEWRVGVNTPIEGATKVKIEVGPQPMCMILRPPRRGDIYASDEGSKKVSRLLIDAKVPLRLRAEVPILEINGRIQWLWLPKERKRKFSRDAKVMTVWIAVPKEFFVGG